MRGVLTTEGLRLAREGLGRQDAGLNQVCSPGASSEAGIQCGIMPAGLNGAWQNTVKAV